MEEAYAISLYFILLFFCLIILYYYSTVDPTEIPLTRVVDSWEVYTAQTRAHTGVLDRPSHHLLQTIFGTTKFEDIFEFMANHGHVKECPKRGGMEGKGKV